MPTAHLERTPPKKRLRLNMSAAYEALVRRHGLAAQVLEQLEHAVVPDAVPAVVPSVPPSAANADAEASAQPS